MSRNSRIIDATPQQVFDVLADGWLYPAWVVGASRIRYVDARWPAVDSELHHSFGVWPLLINDKTVVLECEPPRRVALQAHGWPIGEARVVIHVKARGNGSVVRIEEDAVEGPGRFVPEFIRSIGLSIRNRETLRRLAWLAEGGAGATR
ncbi:SRPBCC domain-containing protein [Amnibacterium flavum]|uniref:SRPBCC family protein n=1 Tax=Amnibacterium flavum TaxID=2173173 RepID=A0A2V1HU65_9MICO|nr:SRPBCC family protein [Amnibacterium flavum]PVZ96156.1 SRPBCC family protein [Amnibacterium flavum]